MSTPDLARDSKLDHRQPKLSVKESQQKYKGIPMKDLRREFYEQIVN